MGSYFGSKATSGLCQPIIALMPPHDTYIETHLGGGAIMKRKPPALHNIGSSAEFVGSRGGFEANDQVCPVGVEPPTRSLRRWSCETIINSASVSSAS